MSLMHALTEDQIRQALLKPLEIPRVSNIRAGYFEHPARPAAVLVPFAWLDGPEPGWQLIFTRRTDLVGDHKGQVAFPGGRADPGDEYPTGTALREANEEIGLQPCDVRILGHMEGLHTISNYLVTPVVGVIPWPYIFKPQPDEVQRVFQIPLRWLVDPAHYEIRQREVRFSTHPDPITLRVIYFEPYDQEILWGISAEITLRLLNALDLEK